VHDLCVNESVLARVFTFSIISSAGMYTYMSTYICLVLGYLLLAAIFKRLISGCILFELCSYEISEKKSAINISQLAVAVLALKKHKTATTEIITNLEL
jgi:hypothetical protein